MEFLHVTVSLIPAIRHEDTGDEGRETIPQLVPKSSSTCVLMSGLWTREVLELLVTSGNALATGSVLSTSSDGLHLIAYCF